MPKIFELLNKREPKSGDFGIEIEAEGNNLRRVDNKWWGTHDDGSLRGVFPVERAEFVLNNPVPKKSVKAVLKQLVKELPDAEFKFSFRTSVHVHMNVQDLEYVQMLNVIYTYLLLEEPLLTYCGRSRKGNRFCLRLQDAEGILDTLGQMFCNDPERGLGVINQDNVRYASINIGALLKYGSLEFRAMRGTIDVDVLSTWVDALHNIKEFSKTKEDPTKIYEMFCDVGPEVFFNRVLGKCKEAFLYPRVKEEVARSASLSIDLPFLYREYQERKKEEDKRKEVRKDKEKLLNHYERKHVVERVLALPIENPPGIPKDVIRQVRLDTESVHCQQGHKLTAEYKDWITLNDPVYKENLIARGFW